MDSFIWYNEYLAKKDFKRKSQEEFEKKLTKKSKTMPEKNIKTKLSEFDQDKKEWNLIEICPNDSFKTDKNGLIISEYINHIFIYEFESLSNIKYRLSLYVNEDSMRKIHWFNIDKLSRLQSICDDFKLECID